METLFRILATLSTGLLALLLVGMLRRGRVRVCYTFFAYVTAATIFSTLIFLFPEHYTPEAFIVKQGIYDSLLFGMALELSCRVFSAFRGIAGKARLLLALSVVISSAIVFVLTPANSDYAHLARYQPGITTAGLWCLTFVALLIVWYQVPVPHFTRAILLAYVPYLVVFVVYVDLIGRLGWGVIHNLNVLNAAAYSAAVGYLAHAAWRQDGATA